MYIDSGSSCTNLVQTEVDRLGLLVNDRNRVYIKGYGNAMIRTLGTVDCKIKIDDVECDVKVNVVADSVQDIPLLVGRTFIEQPHVKLIKDFTSLQLLNNLPDVGEQHSHTKLPFGRKKSQ